MLPKHYIETFFPQERNKNLFVAMPLRDDLNDGFYQKLNTIKNFVEKNKIKFGFDLALSAPQKGIGSDDITEKIFDGIINSKALLFDISPDLKYKEQINPNVMYELGVALSFRDQRDILIIRDGGEIKPGDIPFDVNNIHINSLGSDLTEDWLSDVFSIFFEHRERYTEKILTGLMRSLDLISLQVVWDYGMKDQNFSEANLLNILIVDVKQKPVHLVQYGEAYLVISRLLELGLIWVNHENPDGVNLQTSYYWTALGKELCNFIKGKKIKK